MTITNENVGNHLHPTNPKLVHADLDLDKWSDNIQNITQNKSFEPKALMEELSNHATIEECFEKDAGVGEQYTVGQHTEMVLEVATQYRDTFEEIVSPLIDWNEFLIFLSLHDIGKGIAVENESTTYATTITRKEDELRETRAIMESLLPQLGIKENKLQLLLDMLRYDTQGLYLKGEISEDEAFDNICEIAIDNGISPQEFYRLFSAFHSCDAASYPFLFHRIFTVKHGKLLPCEANAKKIQALTDRIESISKGHKVFYELLEGVQKNESADDLEVNFMKHLDSLQNFLDYHHKMLLKLPESERKAHQEELKEIKCGFRDIFLHFAKRKNIGEFTRRYENKIKKLLGNHPFGTITITSSVSIPVFTGPASGNSYDLEYFIDSLINYRKNYLCRFSEEKVVDKIKQAVEKKHFSLLQTTFLHGTNSGLWPNMFLTAMQLVPTGRLSKLGIVPFSGELCNGCTNMGVNRNKVSGCSVDNAYTPMKYARGSWFHTSIDTEINKINSFVKQIQELGDETFFKSEFYTTSSDHFTRLSVAIRRIKALDPENFAKLEQDLKNAIAKFSQDFEQYKLTKNYKDHMPRSKDPDGTLGYAWHDNYWYTHFFKVEGAINALKEALQQNAVVPKGMMKTLQAPYPLIFGSKTLHTKTVGYIQSPSERCSIKAAALGRDIQMIFTKTPYVDDVKSILEANNLQDHVDVLTFEDLSVAMQLNKEASPYFADIVSLKKLNQLDNTEMN